MMFKNKDEKYYCSICDRYFKHKENLTLHNKIKHLKIIKVKCNLIAATVKKKCPKCGREVTIINFNKHYKACKGIINKNYTIEDSKYICNFCGKSFKKQGIKTHIWRCHSEEGKIFDPNYGYKNGTRVAWNEGLTKETDERIKKQGQEYSKNHKLGLHKKPEVYKHVLGAVRNSKCGWYNGYYCDSSWELAFLIYNLDVGNEVIREEKPFKYIFNNKEHHYYPDFIVNGVYYEIKGRDSNVHLTEAKLQAVRNLGFDIVLIKNKDIEFYIKYVKNKYKVNNVWDLYNNIRRKSLWAQ